jgi:hypothetical protein
MRDATTPVPPERTDLVARQPSGRGASPEGNTRLTAMTGAVLLILFTAECLTTLSLGNLLTLHVFLGMLLLGPVALKMGSTLWRFTRYYTGSEPYARKGPPPLLQRVLGPLVILTSLAVRLSGVALVFTDTGQWMEIHKDSFFLWLLVLITTMQPVSLQHCTRTQRQPELPRRQPNPGPW